MFDVEYPPANVEAGVRLGQGGGARRAAVRADQHAVGIEPTNAPLFGPDRSGPHAGAPVLEPGETRTAGVTLTLG